MECENEYISHICPIHLISFKLETVIVMMLYSAKIHFPCGNTMIADYDCQSLN